MVRESIATAAHFPPHLKHESPMEPTRVGIIGAGMAGPVLAIFLKAKGYSPIVYERNEAPSDAGLGIGYGDVPPSSLQEPS